MRFQTGLDSFKPEEETLLSLCVNLKLLVRERMVLVNRREIRAGEISMPNCEVDFSFNDGNETAKEEGLKHSFSL